MAKNTAYWLMKTEPDTFSIDDLARRKTEPWDGVRNYQARNHMRSMKVGDLVLFYHSNAKPPGVVGLAKISGPARPDPSSWNPKSPYFDAKSSPETPRWDLVEVEFVEKFPRIVALEELRAAPELEGMVVIQRSRLSVQPVTPTHFAHVVRMAKAAGHSTNSPPS